MKALIGWMLLALFALIAFSRPLIAHAQTSSALALEQRADLNVARPGDRLTLTLILTNTGAQPVSALIVSDNTPDGTVFFGASAPRTWLITTPLQDQSGSVIWRSTAALQPHERMELQLIVTIQSVAEILSPGFTVTADQLSQPLTSSALKIAVQPKASEAVVGPSIGWLAIVVLVILIIGAWRWRFSRH